MTMQLTGSIPSIELRHRLRIAREFAGLEQAECQGILDAVSSDSAGVA